MTTAERPRSHVLIAGVPWPVYKLIALVAALLVLLSVDVVASAATAVLAAAATGTAVWLVLGPLHRPRG